MLPIGDDQEHERPPVVNWVLVGLNAASFVVFCLPRPGPRVLQAGGLVAADVDPATLLSHLFLHADLFHLLGNMLFLWIFGRMAEERLGRSGYVLFYLVSGLAAAFLHIVTAEDREVPLIGSSGAVSGTIGACLIFCPRAHVKMLFWFLTMGTFMVPVTFWAILWFFEQAWFSSLALGGTSYYAHVGGFAAGAAIAWILGLAPFLRRARPAPLEPKDAASLMEPRRPFAHAADEGDPAFLDDSIDAYAVVTLREAGPDAPRIARAAAGIVGAPKESLEAGLRSTLGVVARRIPRASAERLRRDLQALGIGSALVADQPANHPPEPSPVDAASWDDRLLRLRIGNQVVPIPWSSPFLSVAARLDGPPFIDLFLSRRSAYRIQRKPGLALTRVDPHRRSEEAVDLAGLAQDLERLREGTGNDEGMRLLAAGGEALAPAFGGPSAYDDYLFRAYHLARAGNPVRRG
jgi:membrane associated rhomboid family serine protease